MSRLRPIGVMSVMLFVRVFRMLIMSGIYERYKH